MKTILLTGIVLGLVLGCNADTAAQSIAIAPTAKPPTETTPKPSSEVAEAGTVAESQVLTQQIRIDLQQAALLTPQQTKLLQALAVPIAVPGYVPEGFKLDFVQAKVPTQSRYGGAGYLLVYRQYDAEAGIERCFAIESTGEGVGGIPVGEQSYPVNNAALSSVTSSLEYGFYGQASEPTLLGNWIGEGPFYRFVGMGVVPELNRCSNLEPREAVKISESLQFLSTP